MSQKLLTFAEKMTAQQTADLARRVAAALGGSFGPACLLIGITRQAVWQWENKLSKPTTKTKLLILSTADRHGIKVTK